MKYNNITEGTFLSRPNRFIAHVLIEGQEHIVHVKNTGRCKELLVSGAKVYLEKSNNPNRKTEYDLVSVQKGSRLINMDSQSPNAAVGEWLKKGNLFHDPHIVRAETKYGKSRFDFYVEAGEHKIFIEVKGVTLEKDGIVSFPDAPSERAVKHVKELIDASKNGYEAFIFFVIQMKEVLYFTPNATTHQAFADILEEAANAGVHMLAYDCFVGTDSMEIRDPVKIKLNNLSIK